jgi:hypothetical protein
MNFSLSPLVAMALFIMATAKFIPYVPAKVGAPFPVDPEDPNVLVAADFAVADSYDPTTIQTPSILHTITTKNQPSHSSGVSKHHQTIE